MKEGWKYKKLGEVCDFEGGSQPPKSEWLTQQLDGYVRMLQIRDFTKSRSCEIEYVKMSKKLRLCKSDDILIGRYGASVGKILTGLEGAYNVAIIKSIPNESVISKKYIRRFFESGLFQNHLIKICNARAAQAGFSKEDIYDVQIPVPPLPDQQRIVSYLDAEFANIEALKANAEKQLQAAKDLFQAALKELLTPKEGWVEKKLGELCHIVGGGTPSKRESKYYGGNIPWASIRDMNFDILSETELCITNEGLKNSTSHLINKGEIVIATRVGLGKVCILAQDTAINQDIKGIIPKKENIDRLFMFYFFKKNAKFIEENGVGATVKGVKIQFIENLSFPMIKISEQQRIAARLDALFANVKALQTNYTETITLCNDLKQALLKKVFG